MAPVPVFFLPLLFSLGVFVVRIMFLVFPPQPSLILVRVPIVVVLVVSIVDSDLDLLWGG